MKVTPTGLEGACVAETASHRDSRGSFSRLFCQIELEHCLRSRRIIQVNHSETVSVGALRGLHFQCPPHSEMKLVRCLKGRVWDVVVDVRWGSPTFLKWHAEELCPANGRMMIVPEGFAHGFQALEPNSELLYLHTSLYTPTAEAALRFDDPRLSIHWPLPVTDISLRDSSHPYLNPAWSGIEI